MRPVNKGKREQEYKPYQTAKRELFEAIGPYCSYCERIIELGGAIEHIQPKRKHTTRPPLCRHLPDI